MLPADWPRGWSRLAVACGFSLRAACPLYQPGHPGSPSDSWDSVSLESFAPLLHSDASLI